MSARISIPGLVAPTTTCPMCQGHGWYPTIEPDCCGRINELGYCRGDCAIPKQVQRQCDYCGGGGKVYDGMFAEDTGTQEP